MVRACDGDDGSQTTLFPLVRLASLQALQDSVCEEARARSERRLSSSISNSRTG